MNKRLIAAIIATALAFPYAVLVGFVIIPIMFTPDENGSYGAVVGLTAISTGGIYALVCLTLFVWGMDFWPIRELGE